MKSIQMSGGTWQLKVFPILTALGWVLILLSFVIGAFVLTPTAAGYWGGNAKAIRDQAGVDSLLLGQLRTLTTTSRWLVPLTFVGVASFMVGIALEFSSIPALLKNRGKLLSVVFPHLLNRSHTNTTPAG